MRVGVDRPVPAVLRGGWQRRVALGVAVPVLLLGMAQALLPWLAVQQVKDQVKPYGSLQSVTITAWPAVELLWGKAQSATATAGSLRMSESQMVKMAVEARGVHEMRLTVGRLAMSAGGLPHDLVLRGVTLHKQGDRLTSTATVTQAALDQALPSGFSVEPLVSEPGTMRVRASGGLFGAQATLEAVVMAREGKLVAVPQGLPLLGLLQITLFSDPHMYMEGISISPTPGERESWTMELQGTLR